MLQLLVFSRKVLGADDLASLWHRDVLLQDLCGNEELPVGTQVNQFTVLQ